MTQIDRDAPVLVTGGSGYIASWIIKLLLDQGRSVHTTTRDPKKTAHLDQIAAGTGGTLKQFQADLLTPGSFDAAMQGCQVVMHTASPFLTRDYGDAETTLVRPAVEGTRNVLEAATRAQSVRRVVLTSSVAAVYGDNCELSGVQGGAFTEEHWNNTSSLQHNPYQFAKAAAEREAMRIQRTQQRWDLVTLNPSMVFGPSLTKTTNSGSVGMLRRIGSGKYKGGVPPIRLGCVDVRDVARAHVLAADKTDVSGRNILSADVLSLLQIGQILQEHYPRYALPKKELPKALVWLVGPLTAGVSRTYVSRNMGLPLRFDNTKSRRELGISYRPLEQTFTEHFKQLVDDNLVPP